MMAAKQVAFFVVLWVLPLGIKGLPEKVSLKMRCGKSSNLCHPAVKYSHVTCDVLTLCWNAHCLNIPGCCFHVCSTTVYHRRNDLGGPELYLASVLEVGKS